MIAQLLQWMASGSLGVAGAPVTSRAGAEYAYVTVLVTVLSLAGSHVKARKKTRAVVTIFHVQVRFCLNVLNSISSWIGDFL